MNKTVFEKIIDRELPAQIILETDRILVFHDIQPEAPVHLLVIPKKAIPRLAESSHEDSTLLGELLIAAQQAAQQCGLEKTGYRIIINNGPDAGETVPHLHIHVLGGRKLHWPPG
jgi:histidine triad (HIT) family protein